MEKTAAKAFVEVEQKQLPHGGKKTAAAEVIIVDDPEAVSCPKCLHPLKPPVFQCATGHLICSSCHDMLPDKNKCASCFINTGYSRYSLPTSYSRCHGVERILRSVRVACPYAIYGCTSGKMLYHEKEEHEKTCPIKDSSMKRQGRVLKIGPYGGSGGKRRDMDVRGIDRILKVVVWHRDFTVDAMTVVYERHGREEQTEQWGTPAGECSEICLESDEYLTGLKGHLIHYNNVFMIRSLIFVSNRQTFGPYGKEDGVPFELPAAGGRIVGFHGRSKDYLNALGTYVKMVV
ncbi:jacalin-related lectin 3-like [Lolium rigidum]|uniref:jacalin-related lectin 3-like n=1 Tax=Lolium rigidum TaxID=89674 RepID=UPI001F5C4C68|nr:jacalin-related lectin 3-like [Lolium rigidum]